jgi:MFS family permease
LSGSITIVLPVLAAESFGGAVGLGWLLSAMAAGALLASLAIGQFGRAGRRGLSAYLGVGCAGACLFAVAFSQNLGLSMLLMLGLGASLVVFGVVWESTVQELVPAEMLGRVISIDMLGSYALLPIGYVLLGYAVTALGVTAVLSIAGAATVALVLVGLSVPEVRRLA